MSHRKTPGRVVLSRDEWDAHLAEDERVRRRVVELEAKLAAQEGRAPPPPSWVKANVEKPPEEERKKRGAKFGHAPHFRPPPEKIHETRAALLDECPDCGGQLQGPFDWDDHLVESVIPGHVRVTRYRIARYRCRSCKKVRRARVPPDVAPDRSRFSWGTHFLVGYWSLRGMTNSMIRDLSEEKLGLVVSGAAPCIRSARSDVERPMASSQG